MSGRPKRNGPANAGPFALPQQDFRKGFARPSQVFARLSQVQASTFTCQTLAKTCQTLAKHLRNTCQTAPLCILPPAPLCAATPLRGRLPRLHRLQPPRLRHPHRADGRHGACGGFIRFYYGVTFQCASNQLLPLLIFTSNGTDSCMAPDMCSRTRVERASNSSGQVSKMSSSWTCRIILLRIFRSFIA